MLKLGSSVFVVVLLVSACFGCAKQQEPKPENLTVSQLYERGKQSLAKKDFKTALTHFKELTVKAPNFAEGFLHLGLTFNALGKPDRAEAVLKKALEIGFPKQSREPQYVCLAELLVAQIKQNRIKEAKNTFNQIVSLGLRIDDAAGRAIALLLDVGKKTDAKWFADQTLKAVNKPNCYFQVMLSRLYYVTGDYNGALNTLQDSGCEDFSNEAKSIVARLNNRFRRGSHFPIPQEELQAKRLSKSSQENLSLIERKRACTILNGAYETLFNKPDELTKFVVQNDLLRQSALGFNYLSCVAYKSVGYKNCLKFFPDSEETLRDFCLAQVFWAEMLKAGVYGTNKPDLERLKHILNLAKQFLPPGRFDKEVAESLLSKQPPPDDYAKGDAYSYMDFNLLREMFAPHSGACNEFPDEAGRATCKLWKHILDAIHGTYMSVNDRARLLEECERGPLTPDLFVEIYFIIYAYTLPHQGVEACKEAFFKVAPRYCKEGAGVALPQITP